MTIDVIKIGNSKGIRLSKTILQRYNIGEKLEIFLNENEIVLKANKRNPREGWAEAFKQASEESEKETDDLEDFRNLSNKFDEEEWEWK